MEFAVLVLLCYTSLPTNTHYNYYHKCPFTTTKHEQGTVLPVEQDLLFLLVMGGTRVVRTQTNKSLSVSLWVRLLVAITEVTHYPDLPRDCSACLGCSARLSVTHCFSVPSSAPQSESRANENQ